MFGFKIVFWYWWALAAVLLVFEMLLPGVVFLFLAIGAAAAGFVLLVVSDLSLELQLVLFAVVAVASAVGKPYAGSQRIGEAPGQEVSVRQRDDELLRDADDRRVCALGALRDEPGP